MIRRHAKLKKSNYMMQTVFFLSSIMLVLIGIFSCIVTIFFSYRTDSMYTSLNSQALEQLAVFTDEYIFENIDKICDTYFNTDSEYEPAKKFFNNLEDMSRDEMLQIRQELFSIEKNNAFLKNIYLYNSRFDSFISTGDGIVFGASDSRNHLSIENRFFTYLDSINSNFYVPQDDNVMLRDQDGLIIYVHYVSSNEDEVFRNKQVSCVVMVIDVKTIVEFLQKIEVSGVQSFAIIDHNQRALIHSSNFPGINYLIQNKGIDFDNITSAKSGNISEGFLGKRTSCIWFKSNVHDWNYMYLVSRSDISRNILLIILVVMILAFIIIITGFLIIRISGKKLYKPFNDTMQKALKSLTDSDENSDDELTILNQLIDEYGNRKKEFTIMHKEYSYLSLHAAATDIIRGFTQKDTKSVLERLDAYGIDFSKKEYGYILIEFNPLFLSTFSVDQNDFILYDVMDALKETFNCVVAVTSSTTVELVINYDKIDFPAIILRLKSLIPEKSFINIYFHSPTNNLSEISQYHTAASNMTKYSYLYSYDNIFNVEDLLAQDLNNTLSCDKDIVLLETLLKNGDAEQFNSKCNKILSDVKSEKCSYNYVQNIILRIFSTLCRVAKELDIEIQQSDFFRKITNNKNFDTTTMYLFEFSDEIFDKLSSKDNERKFDMINSIKLYIDEHITEDISLSSIAQHFNISVGYLSKFFKENAGQPFSKYIIEKKFACAAQMLIECPEKSVNDIANDFGYFDTAYFSRQFKSHHGVTPTQYRKLNQ